MNNYNLYHSVNQWLPNSAGWIYEQIQLFGLDKQFVLADKETKNAPDNLRVIFAKQHFFSRFVKHDFRIKAIKKTMKGRSILFSHFGNRAWHDLHLKVDKRIARFYGYDVHQVPFENNIWFHRYLELFTKTDLVITEGPFMKNSLMKMGCSENKIAILPLGVHVSPNWLKRSITKTFNILIASRFKEKKGIDTALLACLVFMQNQPRIDIKIHLIGDSLDNNILDNEYIGAIEKLIENPILHNKINRYGFVSKLRLKEIALQCQVGLLPSQWAKDRDCEGGFPLTILELMETGLPIISTMHCDIPVVINNENGLICQERNIHQLANALSTMQDEETLQKKSTNARKTVEEQFDWQILKPLYHQIILS